MQLGDPQVRPKEDALESIAPRVHQAEYAAASPIVLLISLQAPNRSRQFGYTFFDQRYDLS
ncbi:hypothetical protein J2Z31_002567 [Sinorhizobium kostiense]|uniref:Uncharacterized protein n=1 Tax=Sinorhizobium kostiense TaxID=76747 RepID=A0ABS4QZL2_9HYPH|nr:hypothetical protein [Sinorhizobium kostiense]